MKFYTFGHTEDPVIIMLAGSFCSGKGMEYLYDRLKEKYYIIVPEYNGHYENSGAFTTRQGEAGEIREYIIKNGISVIEMVYGQSMGAEVAIELVSQLRGNNVAVKHTVLDGAPCVKLPRAYKAFMYIKFKTLINTIRNKDVDEIIGWKFLDKFTNGDTASLRSMLESMKSISGYITEESVKNECECCYTFDFPKFPAEAQKNMHFFYAREEKAYKACFKYVKAAYPEAEYRVESGCGHLTFSVKNTNEYMDWIDGILKS